MKTRERANSSRKNEAGKLLEVKFKVSDFYREELSKVFQNRVIYHDLLCMMEIDRNKFFDIAVHCDLS